jgi:hypothetical protein
MLRIGETENGWFASSLSGVRALAFTPSYVRPCVPLQVTLEPMLLQMSSLVPLYHRVLLCRAGEGFAVCPTLGLAVASAIEWPPASEGDDSDSDSDALGVLHVFRLPREGLVRAGFTHMGTLAGPFKFYDGRGTSGSLAFTGPATARLLIVTSHVHDVVHVIDLLGEKQVPGGHQRVEGLVHW